MTVFNDLIKSHCANIGWSITELKDESAKIDFSMESGRKQTVYAIQYGSVVELSVPSAFAMDSEDEVPHILSTALLQKNSQYKLGAWCIEKISDKYVYSIMHNCDMRFFDKDNFVQIVKHLITECDEFEGTLLELASCNSSNGSKDTANLSQSSNSGIDWGRVINFGIGLLNIFIPDVSSGSGINLQLLKRDFNSQTEEGAKKILNQLMS